jgi:hypothetical protein
MLIPLITLIAALSVAPPVAEVRDHNGAPTLFINGAPHPGMSYMTYKPSADNFRKIGEAGVHLYSFSATPTDSTYNLAQTVWTGPETFDYSTFDARVQMLLDADPEALFFPRLFLGTPSWWADAHPNDLVTYDPNDGTPPQVLVIRSKRVASWASPRWREDTDDALRRFIAYVEASPYADRVIGYHLASGTTEEWMQWGSNEDQWADYSPVNLAAFRRWLAARYGTDTALQKAWRDRKIKLSTAQIPSRSKRQAGERDFLRDPVLAQPSIDYVRFTSWLTADAVNHFAKTTKDAVNRERLVGVFYGYLCQLAGGHREQNAGHLALQLVLTCPDIDFITSPSSYASRPLGTGYPHTMSLVDSVKAHGKLWFDENDYRTWLTPNVEVGKLGKTASFEESLLCQQREFAWATATRMGMWWFDMGGGWYDDPRMLAAIGDMNRIAHANMDLDGRPVAEIAFVVDDHSNTFLRPNHPWGWPALVTQMPELGRIGAPIDFVHPDDLALRGPYKMLIYPNLFEGGDNILKNDGRKAVVLMGPTGLYTGATGNERIREEAMRARTGFPLRLKNVDYPWRATPSEEAGAWGWRNATPYGTSTRNVVLALPDPGDYRVLARLEGTQQPALIAREQNGITVAHSAVPQLPHGLLRAVADKAGIHAYTKPGTVVWASRGVLAVSVGEGGPQTIRLPRPAKVTDLWTGAVLHEQTDQFDLDIPTNGTALLRLD